MSPAAPEIPALAPGQTQRRLSVVVVSYNVRYFLEQCLESVKKALENWKEGEAEVFVVDNASVDNSPQMVQEKFPWVRLLVNAENKGFAKANNQAIQQASGRYILLLNPDTLIQPDTLTRLCDFMDQHADAGGLGVRMVDGSGRFLPESKRGLPTPLTAFFKVCGLAALFPKSRLFGRYHVRYLDEFQVHSVEVLSGAFMLLRRSVLEKIGGLDEDFFMYGEDIDLSYRILKAGYKNYYFPHTTIIHYKGESTQKGSLNYVKVFYQAMIIFAEKHFTGSGGLGFRWIIRGAVVLRATLALARRFLGLVWLPLADAMLGYGALREITLWWATHVKTGPEYYPPAFLRWVVPAYLLVWLLSAAAFGAYSRNTARASLVKGIAFGTLIILAVYALLPEHWRFSRALILSGAVSTGLVMGFLRSLLRWFGGSGHQNLQKKAILVARDTDFQRIRTLLLESGSPVRIQTEVSVRTEESFPALAHRIQETARVFDAQEVIFSGAELSSDLIIRLIDVLSETHLDFKIAPPESAFIIGSHSVNRRGDLYVMEVNALTAPYNRFRKRCVDVALSVGLLLLTPFLWLGGVRPAQLVPIIWKVLIGRLTWVGPKSLPDLGHLKPAVLAPWHNVGSGTLSEHHRQDLERLYLRDYVWWLDVPIVFRNLKKLVQIAKD